MENLNINPGQYEFTTEIQSLLLELQTLIQITPKIHLIKLSYYIERLKKDTLIGLILANPNNPTCIASFEQATRKIPGMNGIVRLLKGLATLTLSLNAVGAYTNAPKYIKVEIKNEIPRSIFTNHDMKEFLRSTIKEGVTEIACNTTVDPINPNVKIDGNDLRQLLNMRYQLDLVNKTAHDSFNYGYKSVFASRHE